jgi:hypothetical protein
MLPFSIPEKDKNLFQSTKRRLGEYFVGIVVIIKLAHKDTKGDSYLTNPIWELVKGHHIEKHPRSNNKKTRPAAHAKETPTSPTSCPLLVLQVKRKLS